MRRGFFALIFLAGCMPASADTARAMMPSCRAYVVNTPTSGSVEIQKRGQCVGIIETAWFLGKYVQPNAACPPKETMMFQVIQAVLNEADTHPELLDLPMPGFVAVALYRSWPCSQ
jgi:hypothetical protein